MQSRHWRLALLAALLFLALSRQAVVRADNTEEEDDYDDEADAPSESGSDVVVGTDANLDKLISSKPHSLVEFYAPWCGHCKSLAPEYEKAATALKSEAPDVHLIKVDATEQKEVASKFGVNGYPTLKWFVNGKPQDYGGGRTADEIVRWVKKRTGPPAEVLSSVDQVAAAKANKVSVFGYFKALEGDDFKAFEDVARAAEDLAFFATSSADVAKEVGIDAAPGYAVGRNYGKYESSVSKGHPTFKGKKADAKAALEAFILQEKLPVYVEFGPETQAAIFKSGIGKQLILVGSPAQLYEDATMQKALQAVHDAYKGRLVVVTANTDTKPAEDVAKYFGLDPKSDDVQVVGFYDSKGKKFKLKEAPTQKALLAFADSLVEGTAVPDYKSEEVPAEAAGEGEVVTVVGKNFEQVVLDDSKDVLLEVYAPWCGHCKKLVPIYKKLAKRFRKVPSVVIAKMDGTANEHAAMDGRVQGFPTIMLYPAGAQEPIMFNSGERTVKSLTKFIKDNAKVKFELPKKKKGEDDDDDDKADHSEL